MNVLIACEESQKIMFEFRLRGHNSFSCDLQKCSGGFPEYHILGDIRSVLFGGHFHTEDLQHHYVKSWDLIIAHPPCTFLSNAGACRLYPKAGCLDIERYQKGLAAKDFFMLFYNLPVARICIENPLPSKVYGLPPYTQIIQPYEFGDPYSKRTCLWLRGLEPLSPTNILKEYKPFIASGTSRHAGTNYNSGTVYGSKKRSKTFDGIAAAMASQWG